MSTVELCPESKSILVALAQLAPKSHAVFETCSEHKITGILQFCSTSGISIRWLLGSILLILSNQSRDRLMLGRAMHLQN